MSKNFYKGIAIAVAILGFGSVAFALPFFQSNKTIIPTDSNQDLGTTTSQTGQGTVWRTLFITNTQVSTTTTGCKEGKLTASGIVTEYFVGTPCGSGGGTPGGSNGQLQYNASSAFGGVSTTTVTCTGSTSCTQFVAIGASPITITSSGASASFAFPFDIASHWQQTTAGTSTALWLQGSPFSLFASSTSVFTNATSSQLTTTGKTWFTGLGSAGGLYVDTNGLLSSGATTTAGTGLTYTGNAFNCNTASASVFGCLPAASFSQFNSATTTFTNPIIYTLGTNAVTCQVASGSLAGCLSSADWTTFNSKQAAGTYLTALGSGYATTTQTAIAFSTTTTSFNGLTVGAKFVPTAGAMTYTPVWTGTLDNTGLTASTISGVSLGGTLNALTATNGSLTFSGSYDGTLARTVGLNVGNTNTWTILQNFNYSSTSQYASFVNASSTNLFAGSFTIATSSAGCAAFMSSGLLTSTGTACGSGGSFTSFTAGAGLLGGTITNGQSLFSQVGTSTVPTVGQLAYWTKVGGTNTPALLNSVATTSETCTSPLSCTSFDVLTGGGAITLGTITVAKGGTNATSFAANTLIASDSLGTTLVSTTTPTFGQFYATSTTATSTIANALSITGGGNNYLQVGPGPNYAYSPEYVGDVGKSLANDFVSFNVYNNSNTACASADLTTNHANATALVGYTDLGVTSDVWTGAGCGALQLAQTGVLYNSTYLLNPQGPQMAFWLGTTSPTAKYTWGAGGYASSNIGAVFFPNAGRMAWATTTPSIGVETIASSTAPQLVLSDGTAGDASWTFRNASGNFYIATTSVDGLSTTTVPALSVNTSGNVGMATTSSNSRFSIDDPIGNNVPVFSIGSSTGDVLEGFNNAFPQLFVGATTTSTTQVVVTNVAGVDSLAIGSSTGNYLLVNKTGKIFAPNTSTSGSNQTGYWCYDGNAQLIRDTIVCVAVSAKRFKYDIQTLNVGLSKLLQLNPISYKLKPDFNVLGKDDPNLNGTQYSLVADDVQKIDPHLVTVETATTTFEGITYPPGTVHGLADTNNWVGFLVQSIKDFYAEFQKLVAKVSGLEERLNSQQKQIDNLQAQINKLKK